MTKDFYDFLFHLRSSEFVHNTPENLKDVIYRFIKGENLSSYSIVSNKLDGELGILSPDKIRDLRYMIVGINFIVCEIAVEQNVDAEYAYGISDYLINVADDLTTVAQFDQLINDMFTSYRNLIEQSSRTNYGYPIDKCIHYIDQNLYSVLTVSKVADAMKLSPSYLTTIFHAKVGTPLYQYIKNRKFTEAKLMLENTQRTITEIASGLGYHSLSHFSNAFKSQAGIYPYEYRNRKIN